MPFVPDIWQTLRLRYSDLLAQCTYSDSLGRKRTFRWRRREITSAVAFPARGSFEFSRDFARLTQTLVQDMPNSRWHEYFSDTAPLGIFVAAPSSISIKDVEAELSNILTGVLPSERIQCVQLSPSKAMSRTPLRLPLNILAAGEMAQIALSDLKERRWFGGSDQVKEFGIRIQSEREVSRETLSTFAADIVVTDDTDHLFDDIRKVREQRRPRLVILLGKDFREPSEWKISPGVALLMLPDPASDKSLPVFLKAFVYGVVHDFPLHAALKSAILEEHPESIPLLIADPHSNQSLRIMDALIDLRRQSDRLQATLPTFNFQPLFERAEAVRGSKLEGRLPSIRTRISDLRSPAQENEFGSILSEATGAQKIPAYFSRESNGLIPMAEVNARFATFADAESLSRRFVKGMVRDQGISQLLRAHQQRFVDVAIERLETDPLLGYLDGFNSLKTNALYQLRVHVGNRLPDSIVVGKEAPIDPILPATKDPRGHQLEFTVQAKDFSLISEQTQKAWLPEFGATTPVYFKIRAPKSSGTKHLRICVYSQNYLIQSYEFSADVAEDEYPRAKPETESLYARLEYSRTDRFSDLERFHPRRLSIGANSNGNSSTHQLIVKSDQTSGDLTLFPGTYDWQVKKFRATLEAATIDPRNPNVSRVYPAIPDGQAPASDVAQIFRDLAKQGRNLYDAVFGKAARGKLRKSLVQIAQTSDEKLQVIRFDENFVFPWAILYDFALPDEIYGQPGAPVCLGVKIDAAGTSVACDHTNKDNVYCVNGFWGVRHFVEEILGQGTSTNPTIDRAISDAIRVVADPTLPGAYSLIQNLTASIGALLVKEGPIDPDQLLDLLWVAPPTRPTILIVLGHLTKEDIVGQPEGPRVELVANSTWLLQKKISERAGLDADGWCQPRTVVLMMACDSAATEVATVNDFVTAWNTAGAGAIVGTECIVGSNLAAEFAESVTKGLWGGKTLGETMTAFRRDAVKQGNPLGLVFHAVGDVDLTVN